MESRNGSEERKRSWFDSLVQAGILLVALYGVVQNKFIWTWILVIALVILLVWQNHTFFQRWATEIKIKKIRRKVLGKYKVRFQALVKEGCKFICGQNEMSIPNRVRQIVSKPDIQIREYNSHVENLFYYTLTSIQGRANNDIETFEEFERISIEFSQTMNSFELIYVDDFARNLKQAEGFTTINEWELADLRKCYASFHNFVDRHNAFRIEIATDIHREANCIISVPPQVL